VELKAERRVKKQEHRQECLCHRSKMQAKASAVHTRN
jgi:hypothetical protein